MSGKYQTSQTKKNILTKFDDGKVTGKITYEKSWIAA